MSRLALDTSAYSAFERLHAAIRDDLERADEIWISSIVLGELTAGFLAGRKYRYNAGRLAAFLGLPGVKVGLLDRATADRYADITQYLRKAGTPLPTNDVWIAAHAMQHGLEVATTDRHFLKVPQILTRLFDV